MDEIVAKRRAEIEQRMGKPWSEIAVCREPEEVKPSVHTYTGRYMYLGPWCTQEHLHFAFMVYAVRPDGKGRHISFTAWCGDSDLMGRLLAIESRTWVTATFRWGARLGTKNEELLDVQMIE
ncbi:MAG: hypothetical protein ACOX3S_10615 [Anaerolineae bacterium]|jgi:hypothetical protein